MPFDIKYLLFIVPGMLFSMYAQYLVKSRFTKYSRIPSTKGYTGAQAAQRLLDQAGIKDVKVVRVNGFLSDHYHPGKKHLALSEAVYDRTSVAAIGVATHEAGHAIQHATGYKWLAYRSLVVPAVQYGSPIGTYAMTGGLALMMAGQAFGTWVFVFGAIAFSTLLLFQLITLPVEFNASARAKRLVLEAGIIGEQESDGVSKVLTAAAMTYVAAFVSTLLTLLYFLYKSGLLNKRRRRQSAGKQ